MPEMLVAADVGSPSDRRLRFADCCTAVKRYRAVRQGSRRRVRPWWLAPFLVRHARSSSPRDTQGVIRGTRLTIKTAIRLHIGTAEFSYDSQL
ncbi:hypothetical protein GCM10009554_32010 [Kribbella koreensis]|uniref:Uncharacterized protein n=1 Tax=Kribbella koreensis TaxID=57909 RepID=A0ABP4ATC1_9ACTN